MPDKDKGSRIEAFKKAGITDIEMPECEALYLVGYLYEIGPATSGGMGESPITHAELRSWQYNTGIELNSWEVRTVVRLSREYLSESQKAKIPTAPAPWVDAPYTKLLAALKLQQALNAMVAL